MALQGILLTALLLCSTLFSSSGIKPYDRDPTLQGMRWSSFPVDSHQFPKLRLKFKQNLISLAGGMTRLPVTDPKVRTAHALQSCKALIAVKTKRLWVI